MAVPTFPTFPAFSTLPTLGGGQWWSDRRWSEGYRLQRFAGSQVRHRTLDPNDRRIAAGSLDECLEAFPQASSSTHLVVLLHGLGRRRSSLAPLGEFLRAHGMQVALLDYASTREPVSAHVQSVQEVLAHLNETQEISFVTHSLGGIVARLTLAEGWPGHLTAKRLVMLAPPSTGADLAARLNSAPFRMVLGPSGHALASGLSVPLPPIPFSIVAGSLRQGRGINPLLEGDDDGIVRVEETRLEGAAEHHQVESIHTTIMNHSDARQHVLQFLQKD